MTNEKTVKIRTLCKSCIFKIETNGVQTSCRLSRLNKFKKSGVNVYLEDNSYIIDKLCNTCRDSTWAKNKNNVIEEVLNEVKPQIDYIILSHEEEQDLNKIKTSIDSIKKQHIQYNSIIVSVKKNGNEIFKKLRTYDDKIKVNQSLLVNVEGLENRSVDECVRLLNGNFYTVINAGEEIDINYSNYINNLINEQLENFVFIDGTDNFPSLYFSKIHKLLYGNKNQPLQEKIKFLAKEQKSSMIKNWKDVIKTQS